MGPDLAVANRQAHNENGPAINKQQGLVLPTHLSTERIAHPELDQSNPTRKWLTVEDGMKDKQLDEMREAIADYNKAIELKPDFSQAYVARSLAFSVIGDTSKAIADYNKAIELKPDFSQAYVARSLAFSVIGDTSRALEDSNKADELIRGL